MERTYKTWGEKWLIFKNDLCEVSVLYLKPQQRCSWHRHKSKFNLFFVIEGMIVIKTEWGLANVDPGQIFTTSPGEWHEFQTRDCCATVIEVMFVQYDSEDIERKEIGGPLNVQ
jgi:mannose-6-phosphate isomerase-like protein (cupin superfamily)